MFNFVENVYIDIQFELERYTFKNSIFMFTVTWNSALSTTICFFLFLIFIFCSLNYGNVGGLFFIYYSNIFLIFYQVKFTHSEILKSQVLIYTHNACTHLCKHSLNQNIFLLLISEISLLPPFSKPCPAKYPGIPISITLV